MFNYCSGIACTRESFGIAVLPFFFIALKKFSVTGVWSLRSDQFSFAIVLIGLICKRAFSGENWKDNTEHPLLWATEQYRTKLKSGFQPK